MLVHQCTLWACLFRQNLKPGIPLPVAELLPLYQGPHATQNTNRIFSAYAYSHTLTLSGTRKLQDYSCKKKTKTTTNQKKKISKIRNILMFPQDSTGTCDCSGFLYLHFRDIFGPLGQLRVTSGTRRNWFRNVFSRRNFL